MPDPCVFDSEEEFHSACVAERQRENPDEKIDQSNAVCSSMWRERDCTKTRAAPRGTVHKAGEALSVGDREAVFVASTDTPDRHGDVVQQNWDFREFRKNPVLLFQHDQSSLPIGRIERVWTDTNKTYARAIGLPQGMDELADKVWSFIKGGFLNAVSVGFLPLEPPQERYSKAGDWLGWTFPKNSLLELSVVSVPANPDALAVARSMQLTRRDLAAIFEKPKGVPAGVKKAQRYVEIERMRASI